MKFLALFKKELREAAVWMILAAVVLGSFGSFLLNFEARVREVRRVGYSSGASLGYSQYRHGEALDVVSGWLLSCSVALGAVVAVRQYWVPTFSRTWAFTLHRSVPRSVVFAAKLGVAVLALALCIGGVWTLLFKMGSDPSRFPVPPTFSVYGHGWIFPLSGLLAYLGTALSGLSTARWYTTKIAGAGFATAVGLFALAQYRLVVAVVVLSVGIAILAVQVARTLESREF